MYRTCTTEKTAQQQRILETCLLENMLKKPFHEITVSGLCEQTGLSRKIFYRLFDKKEDVLNALIDHTLLDFESFQPDPSVKKGGLHRFFAYWKSQHNLIEALVRIDRYSLLWERAIIHTLRESPDIVAVFGANNKGFGRETMTFFLSAIFVLIIDWHEEGYEKSIDEMSDFLLHILTTSPTKGPLLSDPDSNPQDWSNGHYQKSD